MRENIGLNFAAALRSFLRQDPNIILVGEIRDFETAEIAVKAALTGHLVLSTLHTNDAPSTINRLMNMGIEPFLVASSLNLVCAQRLVRRVCSQLQGRGADRAAGARADRLQRRGRAHASSRTRARAARSATSTGYKGRVGLYEVMEITDELRELILVGASALELRRKAVEEGMITLRGSGLRKVKARRHLDRRSPARDRPMKSRTHADASRTAQDDRRAARIGPASRRSASPPQVRVHGELRRLEFPELSPADTKALAYSVLTDAQKKRFEETMELDFSFGIRGIARFRCNMFNQKGAVGAVYRQIPERSARFEELAPAGGHRQARRAAARPRARDRPDRQRQVDDAGGDDRQDQQRAARATS